MFLCLFFLLFVFLCLGAGLGFCDTFAFLVLLLLRSVGFNPVCAVVLL